MSRPAGRSLLGRMELWALQDPAAPALGTLATPGSDPAWTSRAGLLALAGTRAALHDAGLDPVVRVDTGDPVGVVAGLLAAEHLGLPAVLVPADLDEQDATDLLGAARHRWHDGSSGAGLLVLSTSGTRGRPRAVVRTGRSWAAALAPFGRATGIVAGGGPGWAPGPLSSTLTLWAVWHALASGVPVVASGPWRPSHAHDVPRLVPELAWVQCVPLLAERIAEQLVGAAPGRRGRRPARMVLAGASVPDGLRDRVEAAGVALTVYYGAAELSFVAVTPASGGGLRAFPGVAVRIDGEEIWVRSRYVAQGYLGEPGGAVFDPAGWATVGDRGAVEPDGTVVVRGRGDAAIHVGGTTVPAADVEGVLARTPGLAEVVCLPVPDPVLGERILAVVRPDPYAGVDADELVSAVRRCARSGLAPVARPARIVVRTELPRTPGGKIDRATLWREVCGADG